MKKKLLPLFVFAALVSVPMDADAQRLQQKLGRGVVVAKNGSSATVTWRRLAQEPENAQYNVYLNGTKLNSVPLANTNFVSTAETFKIGNKITVTTVVDGNESEPSVPYTIKNFDLRNMYMNIRFDNSPLVVSEHTTKFVWPADLDGDGEMEYVVDRLKGGDNKLEAYTRDGKHLWTVALGPNVHIDGGHDDMVLAYDMDCDGKAEVVVKTSDGTKFWDAENNTFGAWLMGKEDTDGDGIVNYETQSKRNPPQYISVIDGMTGAEKATVEMPLPSYSGDTYTRDNKSHYMGENYSKLQGHMGVCYFDGIHPSVAMEYCVRDVDKNHHYYVSAWGYDFSSGQAGAWKEHFTWSRNDKRPWPAEFHHVRVADVNGDGRDEFLSGGYGVNHKGQMEFSAGISHGDRFRVTDIDPERPGLETFAIQQNAPDMLGQILYDAATGEAIKKWYLSAVGDVGRGECIDITPDHKGLEMWSTMGFMSNAQGDKIDNISTRFPTEGIWWDGNLDREIVDTSDGDGYNARVDNFFGGRLFEIAKESGWRYRTVNGKRASFWGDIIGDWREELVLLNWDGDVCAGIVGFTTDYATDVDNIYCLQEDPAYRLQCTTKGYYQSPYPGFYLGYDMPRPQLPPCMVTDLVWKGTNEFSDYNRSASQTFADGKSVLVDLYTAAAIDIVSTMQPSVLYAMPVKEQTVTLGGVGKFAGEMDLWKSQQGTLVLNVPMESIGTTYISEGTLEVNGEIKGTVDLRARGTLAGNAVVNNITFEEALNYEGCRIAPKPQITFKNGLKLDKRVFLEMDVATAEGNQSADLIKVEGDLAVTAPVVFTIVPAETEVQPGRFTLVEYTGVFSGDIKNFSVRGLKGLSYNILNENNSIVLVINAQREAAVGVKWTGAESAVWDFQTKNFMFADMATEFVAQDAVEFTDNAAVTTLTLNDLMPVGKVSFENDSKDYILNGDGGISGVGMLVKNGNGKLTLNTTKSDYTGATVINSGTVTVKELADGGVPSSLGAASASADNLKIGQATLVVNNSNTATNRGITLMDTATIQVNSGATSLKGLIKGSGMLVKKGNGQLNITYAGTNTWSGGTQLHAGTLAMGAWNTTFGVAASKIEVKGSSAISIFNNNSTGAVPSLKNHIDVDAGKTLTIYGGQRCAVQGKLTGTGTVKITFPYVRGDVSTNMSEFEGVYNVTSGQLRLVSATDLSKGTLKLDAGVYVAHYKGGSGTEQNLTTKIGSLQSTASDCLFGTGTWNVGYVGENDEFAGSFNSASVVNKYGKGEMSLTGASAAKMTIHEGAILANCTSAATTTSSITVNSGAMLAGTGKAASVVVNGGGVIGAGKSKFTVGTLTLTGTLNVKEGAVVRVRTTGTTRISNDELEVAGKVTLNSPFFRIEQIRGELQPDSELKIFTGKGAITLNGEPTIEPAVPMAGYLWDTSSLVSDGIIRVIADPVGIDGIETDTEQEEVYDLSGRKLHKADGKGVYIINGKKVIR